MEDDKLAKYELARMEFAIHERWRSAESKQSMARIKYSNGKRYCCKGHWPKLEEQYIDTAGHFRCREHGCILRIQGRL